MKTILFGSIIEEYSIKAKNDTNYTVCSVTNTNGFQKSSDTFDKQVFSEDVSTYKKVYRNSFAYNPSRINVGSIGCQIIDDCVLVSPLYNIFKINTDVTTSEFVSFFLKTNYVKNYIKEHTQGSVRANFKMSEMSKLHFPDISKEEQSEILEELNLINKIIDEDKKQIDLYDELIKSRFIEMFETIDLSEQQNNWKELGLVSKIYTGTTPSTKESRNWDGDVLWITPSEMNQDTFYVYDTVRKITEIGRKSKSLDLMPINTVLLSTRAPIGKVGIVGKPMTCNQGFKNFECSNEVNPVFLYILLKNNTEYLNSLGSGTTFLEVSKSKISKMLIPVPKIELQNEFESFVKLINKSKFNVQKHLETMIELLNKKMDEYFN